MATALQLTRDGWQTYLAGARGRYGSAGLDSAATEERTRLLGRVREAVRQLRAVYPVGRVVLFGSLAHAAWWDADSDVDIAVQGLEPGMYWQAWRLLEDVVGRPVQLVGIEEMSEPLRKALQRHGLEL